MEPMSHATPTTEVPAPSVPRWLAASRVVRAYVSLTKPRIIELLLVTTIPTMVLAANGFPGWWLVVSTLIGGAMSAGGANTFNSYLDRDIDAIMKRTQDRPLVTGAVTPRAALVQAWALSIGSTLWFYFVVGSPLAALLSAAAILMYAVGYTMLLKRRTAQNIVWGGAAGCMPVLIGWAAVTGELSWAAVVLFLIVFFWTPPHYWPLAMRFMSDYKNAGVPMLPVVAPVRRVTTEILVYSALMVLTSLALVLVAPMTWVYVVVVLVAGGWLMRGAIALHGRARGGDRNLKEMRLFRDSITYLAAVFAAVLLDPFIPDVLTVLQ